MDEDNWPDIFAATDSTPSFLLMNNRDGTFREERGVSLSGNGEEMGGIGVGIDDYDLWPSVLVENYKNIEADQLVTIREGVGIVMKKKFPKANVRLGVQKDERR